jgi:putative Flp pilus-assembly TadE/G-like protein
MRLTFAPRRPGTVVIAVMVCLIALLSVIALSLDGGLVLDKRRQAQAAADSAAIAGASELYKYWFTHKGLDEGNKRGTSSGPAAGEIAAFVKEVAAANGFEDGVDGVSVDVHIPPETGPNAGKLGHCEVKISVAQRRYFSKILGSSAAIPIGARAVSRGQNSTINNGIIILDPDDRGAFQTSGGGTVTVGGSAGVIVNSNNYEAMIANGGGTVTAPYYDVGGNPGWATPGGGSFGGTIYPNCEPTPDPLRNVPQPDPSTMITRSTKRITHSASTSLTLKPGLYLGGISVSGKGALFLEPGIYYMKGGFIIGGQGPLTGYEVMIFNDPQSTSDVISLGGQGAITLTPPTSGPWQGICLFQSRTSSYQPGVDVTGSGVAPMSISGTFYVPKGELKVTGNGTQDTIGSQYISNTLKLGGNGTFNVDWQPTLVPGIREVLLVE